jgi:hypothetical protein
MSFMTQRPNSAPPPPTEIGDFSRPASTQPTQQPPPPTDHPAEAERLRIEEEMRRAKEQESPVEKYRKALLAVKLTPERAAAIIDDMISKGYHEDVFDVIPGRLKIRLRSRCLTDTDRLQRVLEEQRPVFESSTSLLVNEMLLAASIVELGSSKYEHPAADATTEAVEASFTARLTKVRKLGDHIAAMCFEQRAVFDERLRVVCREGAIPNS